MMKPNIAQMKALMHGHLDKLKAFPLSELKKLDPDLHDELLQASRRVDFAYFHEDGNELITAISKAEQAYLDAWEKHFGKKVWTP